jgi:hypothetical protein
MCLTAGLLIARLSAVPLWKVIVGPHTDELQPDPLGSGFFVRRVWSPLLRAGEGDLTVHQG